jgi:glycosyltransferase involved in cell wall biosynthesis
MLRLSVVICTHNPRPHYFRRVLSALQGQTLPKEQWELLVIDNLSSNPLASNWDLSWHPNGRHVLESELGLSPARKRGIRESSGSVLIFVDDDNVLDANYLSVALKIGDEWRKLGTWGSGATAPEFELQPSEAIKRLLAFLALRDVKVPRWGNLADWELTPWGAGMCARREVAEAYVRMSEQSAIRIPGRKGKSLGACDDVEICYVARHYGLGTGIFPELKLLHLIPKERLDPEYLLNLYQGGRISFFLLSYNWSGTLPADPFSTLVLLSILKNCIVKRGLERRQYFADIRALLEARRIIFASQKDQGPISGTKRISSKPGQLV